MSEIKKSKDKKRNSKKRIIITLFQLIFIALIIFSGYKIYIWYTENQQSEKILEDISDTITIDSNNNDYSIDFLKLKEVNPNTVAWIKVNGTNIEYPIVQHTDNSYYLTHGFDNSYNSSGWIFLDYRNKLDSLDKNIIVYGHNRRNGKMFANLLNTLNEDWYNVEENRRILFITENEKCEYEIFSIYKILDEKYYLTTDFKNTSFKGFINTIKKRSIHDFGIDLNENDSILTLSTCDNNNDYRIVIHAKKIE